MPANASLRSIKVKVFGHSASGKTSLIDTLKCGYFVGLLRKAGFAGVNSSNTGSPADKYIGKGSL